MVGVLLRHNAQRPCPASDIQAPMRRIIEQIIGITHARHPGNLLAGLGVQHQEQGWCAGTDKQAMLGFIECHGEIGLGALEGPGGADSACDAVYDGDVVRGRDIHEDT